MDVGGAWFNKNLTEKSCNATIIIFQFVAYIHCNIFIVFNYSFPTSQIVAVKRPFVLEKIFYLYFSMVSSAFEATNLSFLIQKHVEYHKRNL